MKRHSTGVLNVPEKLVKFFVEKMMLSIFSIQCSSDTEMKKKEIYFK